VVARPDLGAVSEPFRTVLRVDASASLLDCGRGAAGVPRMLALGADRLPTLG